MYPIIRAQRFQIEMVVGVDDKGLVFQFTSRLDASPVTASFRPNSYSAGLIRASIVKALEGIEKEFVPFEFKSDTSGDKIRGQFQTVTNMALGQFKRAMFIFPASSHRNAQAASCFLVVVRDGELRKLQTLLEKTFDLPV